MRPYGKNTIDCQSISENNVSGEPFTAQLHVDTAWAHTKLIYVYQYIYTIDIFSNFMIAIITP